jgi:hypothetical protein
MPRKGNAAAKSFLNFDAPNTRNDVKKFSALPFYLNKGNEGSKIAESSIYFIFVFFVSFCSRLART